MARQSSVRQDLGLLILRAITGVIFVAHGWPKLADGASGAAQMFGQLGVPVPGGSAWLVTLLEFFGGLALIAGAFVALVSALFIVHMTMGILLVHLAQGFYVVGPGQGGVEFNLLLIGSLLTLILVGAGKPAVDAMIGGRAGDAAEADAPRPAAGRGTTG